MSISIVLIAIALLMAVLSIIFNQYPLLPVAVILICVVLIIGNR